jgi:hypothetical protein
VDWLLASVTGWAALVDPIAKVPKLRLAGVRVTAITPLPVRVVVCVPLLSVTVRVADSLPAIDGLKVTLIGHEELAASEVPQVLVCAKSAALAPVMETLTDVNAVDWLLASVTGWAALVEPTARVPKLRLVGVRVTATTPVPVRLVVCVPAESTMVRVPVRVPVVVGAKVTLTVQLEPAVRAVPQPLVWAVLSE